MSVRFNNQADRLRRDTNVPALNAVTICGFVQLVVDTNNFSTFSAIHDSGGANYQVHETDGDGVTQTLFDNPGSGFANGALTVGTWYFVAYTAGPTEQWMYRMPVGGSSFTKASSPESNGATVLDHLFFAGHDLASEPLNGRLRSWRVYDAVLSEAELLAEAASLTPVRTSNLNSFFAFDTAANKLVDSSGNGRNLTAPGAGAWETEEDPPIGGEVTGTSAVTLANSAHTASGTHGATGSSSVTLAGSSHAASGAHGVAGSSSVTLEAATSVAVGTHGVVGSSATTLADSTHAASGTFAGPVTGTSAAQLADDVHAATGMFGSFTMPEAVANGRGSTAAVEQGRASSAIVESSGTTSAEVFPA